PGGMAGYNQLLFDDTDSQGRVQLKSSHAYPLPALPVSVCKACLLAALRSGSPFIAPTAA
ncbi:MAG: type VI secretion system Vgr family protein, partial [Janthinobacterium sp.]